MKKPDELKTLLDEYRVPGFKTMARVKPDERDPTAFGLTLIRRQKKQCAADAGRATAVSMIEGSGEHAISIAGSGPFTSLLNSGGLTASGAA